MAFALYTAAHNELRILSISYEPATDRSTVDRTAQTAPAGPPRHCLLQLQETTVFAVQSWLPRCKAIPMPDYDLALDNPHERK